MAATPPTIVDHPSLYSVDRDGRAIVGIVMHGTVGTNSLDYLTKNPRSVSTHYLIPRDGRTIYRMVDEARGANHAGAPTSSFKVNGVTYIGGSVNKVTIGIELESMQTGRDDYTDPQLLAMGWLIRGIRSRHGPLPIFRHATLDPTRRRDPYQLSVEVIEQWVNAAGVVYDPLLKRYRVKHRYVTERKEDNGPPYVRELVSGEEVVVDRWYTNHRVHFADGSGFGDLSDLEAL